MGKKILLICLILIVFLFLIALILVLIRGIVKRSMTGDLAGRWVEIGGSPDFEPCRLTVTNRKMFLSGWDEKMVSFGYSVPIRQGTAGMEDGEVKLELTDCRSFENIIFHEEEVGGKTIPILSGTVFEYDGRGEIVILEFVRHEDLPLIPEGFHSSAYSIRNERDPIPTSMMLPILLDKATEGDLRKSDTFYARIPKNRYGGHCEEGDYAVGSFLLWLCPVELAEDGTILSEEPTAVPYIVSSEGNRENLCLLSGGPDGNDPYGEDICRITTDEKGEIIDAVFIEAGR